MSAATAVGVEVENVMVEVMVIQVYAYLLSLQSTPGRTSNPTAICPLPGGATSSAYTQTDRQTES